MTRSTSESSRSSQGASTTTSRALSDNLKESWPNNARDIYEKLRVQYTEDHWSSWPESSLEIPFLQWFIKFQDSVVSGFDRRYNTPADTVLRSSEVDPQA